MKPVLVTLAILLFAPRQDKIELKYQPQKGDKLTGTKKMTMSVKAKVTGGGQDQELSFEQRNTDKRVKEILEVKDGKVAKATMDVQEDFEESKGPGAEEFTRKENPLHGKKVTLTLKDGQTVIEGIDDPDKKTKKSLKLDDEFSKFFPKRALATGESWDVTGKDLQEMMDDDKIEGKITFKLTGVKEVEKRRCAVLDTTFDIKGKTDDGIDMTMKLTGEVLVWLDRGYWLKGSFKGTVTMKMEKDQMTMNGEGPMTLEIDGAP